MQLKTAFFQFVGTMDPALFRGLEIVDKVKAVDKIFDDYLASIGEAIIGLHLSVDMHKSAKAGVVVLCGEPDQIDKAVEAIRSVPDALVCHEESELLQINDRMKDQWCRAFLELDNQTASA